MIYLLMVAVLVGGTAQAALLESKVATLPGSGTSGMTRVVIDGRTETDCTSGGGGFTVLCTWNGSSWAAGGNASSGASGAVQTSNGSGGFLDSGLTASSSRLTINALGGGVSIHIPIKFDPTTFTNTADVHDVAFNYAVSNTNPNNSACGSTEDDTVHNLGLNTTATGTKDNTARALTAFVFESAFCQGSILRREWFLRHVPSDTTTEYRPFNFEMPISGITGSTGAIAVDSFDLQAYGGSQRMKFDWTTGFVDIANVTTDTVFRLNNPGTDTYRPFLARNAGNTAYLAYPYFDAQDNLRSDVQNQAIYYTTRRAGTGAPYPGARFILNNQDTPQNGDTGVYFTGGVCSGCTYSAFLAEAAVANGYFQLYFRNTGTADTQSNARVLIETAAAGGDPFITFSDITQAYSIGIENQTTGDPLQITATSALGSSILLQLTNTGFLTFSTSTTFAALGAPANGTMVYCSDCDATCAAGASTGQFCKRLNAAWSAM